MRVLITGGTGFIGSHLSRRLKTLGNEVYFLTRRSEAQNNDKPELFYYDGTLNSIMQCITSCEPDIVIHLASLFLVNHKPEDIDSLFESNILLGSHLLEALSTRPLPRLINVGTSWQHYNDDLYNPVNLYAATKQAFDCIVQYYVEAHNLNCITIKLFDTYGPNDTRPKLFNFLKKAMGSTSPAKMSLGEQLIDLVYIDDVVEAFLIAIDLIATNSYKNASYAVSSVSPVKLRELVAMASNICNKNILIDWGGLPYRNREVMSPWTKFELLPGWECKVSLDEGIRRVLVDNPNM